MGASLNPGLSGLFCFGRNSQEGKDSANWGGGLGSLRILQVLLPGNYCNIPTFCYVQYTGYDLLN
jgi:hypothetical protein